MSSAEAGLVSGPSPVAEPVTELPKFTPQDIRPEDVLTRGEVPHSEAAEFVGACGVLSKVIAKESPDIVLFPQRGAGPIAWTTEALLEQDGRKSVPGFVDLPLGNHVRLGPGKTEEKGIKNVTDKKAIVREALAQLETEGRYIPGKTRLMLVDEVQKGGTITEATKAIRDAMDEKGDSSTLAVAAFQDTRYGMTDERRTDAYSSLAAGEKKGVKVYVQSVPLFTVDRSSMLDEVWRDTSEESPDGAKLEEFMTVENTRARRMFRTLADASVDPHLALKELDELKHEVVAEDIGSTLLQHELLEAMTDPVPLRRPKERATSKQIIDWWTHYVKDFINLPKTDAEQIAST